MELKDYYNKYGEEVVRKVLAKLERDKRHVNTLEFKKLLEKQKKWKLI